MHSSSRHISEADVYHALMLLTSLEEKSQTSISQQLSDSEISTLGLVVVSVPRVDVAVRSRPPLAFLIKLYT